MQERIEELEVEKETNNDIIDDVSLIEGDSLSKVLGPKRNGCVRRMGFGVTPKMFKNDNIKQMQELQKANEENTHLKENFATLHKDHQDLKEKYVELKDQIFELKVTLSHINHKQCISGRTRVRFGRTPSLIPSNTVGEGAKFG